MRDDDTRAPVSHLSHSAGKLLNAAKTSGPVTLTRHGQPVAVLLDYDAYRRLHDMEEQAEDLYWTVVAIRQDHEWALEGRPTVSLKEVEARARGRD